MPTKIPMPVITDSQLARLERLCDRVERLETDFQEALMDLASSLGVLRGSNHPEGWAKVTVVPDARKPTLIIEHKAGRRSLTGGYIAPMVGER